MPCRSMSFIVNTCTPDSRTATFSRSSRLRMPTSTVCAGSTFGDKPPMCASSAGSGPSSAASGMPCTLPLERGRGRVHVAVRVDPEQADRQPLGRSCAQAAAAPPSRRRGCDRRRAPAASRRRRATRATRVVELLADAGDVADVFLPFVAPFLRLGNRRRQIALVDDGVAEGGEPLAEAGDAKRRRPHVHAAPAAAEIERHADHVDGDHRQLDRHRHAFVPGVTIA